MTEPVYTYIRGQGWVPSTDQGIEVGWCAHPIGITKEEIASRVVNQEAFFEFIKHLGDGTPVDQLRPMNPSFCYGGCYECDQTFKGAWRDYGRLVIHLRPDDHLARLEAAITLWQTT